MPLYRVTMRREIVEEVELEVEAVDEEEARKRAYHVETNEILDWDYVDDECLDPFVADVEQVTEPEG